MFILINTNNHKQIGLIIMGFKIIKHNFMMHHYLQGTIKINLNKKIQIYKEIRINFNNKIK